MRLYYKVIALLIVITGVAFVMTNLYSDQEEKNYPTWENNSQIIAGYSSKVEIGDVNSTINYDGEITNFDDYNEIIECISCIESEFNFSKGDFFNKGDMLYQGVNKIEFNFKGQILDFRKENDNFEIEISNLDKLVVKSEIYQDDINNIVLGIDVIINVGDSSVKGKIIKKDFVLDDKGFMEVVTELEENNFIVGVVGEVKIITSVKTDVLKIPIEALIIGEEISKYYVDVIEYGEIYRVEIKKGVVGDKFVEIRSGVSSGDVVVVYNN